MKYAICLALTLLATVNSYDARAWSFIVVDSSGHETFFKTAPWDLTYPPKNAPMPVIKEPNGAPQQGTPLTPQQERRRLNADMLIIANIPVPRSSRYGPP